MQDATLFQAVKSRNLAAVQRLLDGDAALANARAEGGESAVLTALYNGAGDIAELLLARGAELNFFEAAAMGAMKPLKFSLAAQPDLLGAFSQDGWTALHLAAFFGRREAAEYLLDEGAPVSPVSRNGNANTPLHAALAAGHGEVAKGLLARGAIVDVADSAGWTPIHLAAANGVADVVPDLLARGARLDAETAKGETPRALAEAAGYAAIADLLRI